MTCKVKADLKLTGHVPPSMIRLNERASGIPRETLPVLPESMEPSYELGFSLMTEPLDDAGRR